MDDAETLAERHPPFPALRALHLRSNGVSSVASLGLTVAKKTLRVLHLQENDISRLDGLAGLRSLEELALDRNRVKSVEPGTFDGLVNLRELRMEENGLKSLSNFEPLVRLRALHLSCNRVAEVSEVEKLGALAELRELTLASNPVTRKQVYRPMALRHCENLRALDGKEVTDEERHHVDSLFSPVDAAAAAAEAAAAIGLERRLSSGSHGDLLGTMGGHPMPSFANAGGLMTTIDTTSGLPSVAHDHGARLALLGVEDDDHLETAARAAGLGTAGRSPEDVSIALMKQIEMQSQLHAQLMEQRKLQQRIEAHGKYLESILERQQRQQHQQHQNKVHGDDEDGMPPGSLS